MPSWDTQRFSLPLLERHVELAPGARLLDLGYYDPRGALWAAERGAHVLALRPSVDLVKELTEQARRDGLTRLVVRLGTVPLPDQRASFDVALLLAPYFLGNAPVRDVIRACQAVLRPTGALYVQVHRRHGGDTYVRYAAQCFHTVEYLGMGGGQRRLYRATAPREPAQTGEQAASVVAAETLHELTWRGATIRLRLAAGVFGARGIDPGSQLLLHALEVPAGARVLDLGCGAGTLGLAIAAADRRGHVVLVDSSSAAVELTRENAVRNNLPNVDVRLSDGYEAVAGEAFDAIVSNIPAHRGHQADRATAERFIASAPAHLRSEGVAWFVANRALGYEVPASRAFRDVRVVADDRRYKVLRCTSPQRS